MGIGEWDLIDVICEGFVIRILLCCAVLLLLCYRAVGYVATDHEREQFV